MTDPTATRSDMPRRRRFRRDTPQPMRLTADDLAIISHVARHRFLRSNHILQLLPERKRFTAPT